MPLSDAEIVIIGGGAVGCSMAYALTKAGKTDVLLIEKQPGLGEVTTSQGAGLCGQVRDTAERTRLAMISAQNFAELQRDANVRPDWHAVGSVRIAETSETALRLRELKEVADQAHLETELFDASEAAKVWPALDFSRASAVLWCPTDGYMRPKDVVATYRHHAERHGARFATGIMVEGFEIANGRIDGVRTNQGRIGCKTVINAAGAHAYHIAKMAGLELPIVPVRHEYFISVPMPGMSPDLPCFRVPDSGLYGRCEQDRLLLGGWETKALRTDPRSYNANGAPPPIEPDWPVLRNFAHDFSSLLPNVADVKMDRVGKGWPTFTPDGRFILGPSSRLPGFVMAGGCNAHGISGSPGLGQLLVESLLDAKPSEYVQSLSPDRFTETTWDWVTAQREAQRVYETYYGVRDRSAAGV